MKEYNEMLFLRLFSTACYWRLKLYILLFCISPLLPHSLQRIRSVEVLALVQLETFNPRLEELDEKWKTAVSNFNECLASLEEQNKIQKEPEKLVTRCNELVNLNSILHEQGEKVNLLIISVQPFHIVIVKYCSSSRLG